MHVSTMRCLGVSFVALLGACGGASAPRPDALEIAVAPLTLPGVGKVCYDLEVTNATGRSGDVVWSTGTPGLNGGTPDAGAICSDRYGNTTGGDVTFVAPCDADGQADADPAAERMNSVTLWFDGLYDTAGNYIAPTGSQGWQNPCLDGSGAEVGCTLDVVCEENADALVAFDFTIMREANQGFFDVAVNFEDIFCSAKVDCREALLHNGDTRDATVVVAFACTSGEDQDSVLQLSDLVLTCDGLEPITIPAAAAPGQQGALGTSIFEWAVYQGDEELTSNGAPLSKCFWNRAIGLDTSALAGKACRLTGAASASMAGVIPPAGATAYPVVRFDVEVLSASGALCGPNPLNGSGSGVQTGYLTADNTLAPSEALSGSFTCRSCSAEGDATCDNVDDDCDGQLDEDYAPTATSCGVGVCTNGGLLTCQDGDEVDSCVPGSFASATNTFDDETDTSVVHVSAYRGNLFCDDITATTAEGLACAPEPGWSATGGLGESGYVFGTAKDFNERHYGLTVDTVALPNLLGGRIEGHFRTLTADRSGAGTVRASEGSANSTANASTGTARARWIITSRNPTTGVIWIWVSKDAFAWNPNDDLTWTERGVDVVWANFAQWSPFVGSGYAGGTAQQFADSVNNVIRIGVIMSDASIVYAQHLDASWYRTGRYGVLSAAAPNNVELGWDELTVTATGSDCNTNGLDDDCDGEVDDCPQK